MRKQRMPVPIKRLPTPNRGINGVMPGRGMPKRVLLWKRRTVPEDTDTIYISPWLMLSADVGTWTTSVNAAHLRKGIYYNSSNTDKNAASCTVYFPAGTYTCKLLYNTSTNRGILKIKIDGITVFTIDQYDGVGANNQTAQQTGIRITTPGPKTVQAIVDGHNASSSGYYGIIQELIFERTE